jgi:hypothetical protein
MVGTTGSVVRTVSVQDVSHSSGQPVVTGSHTEQVEDACVVLSVLGELLKIYLFATGHTVEVHHSEFKPARPNDVVDLVE